MFINRQRTIPGFGLRPTQIKTEILELKSSIKALTERCNAIEKSQSFVSNKHDTAIAALQSVNSQTANHDKKNTQRLQEGAKMRLAVN